MAGRKINRQSRNGALDGFDHPEVLADGTLPSDEVIPYPHPLPQEKALPPRVAKSQKENAT